jgi:leucyl-tRNA synthetase
VALWKKMSKRLYNVVNPDDIIEQYGTDTFRMYEMFLGPLEVSKPWGHQRYRRCSSFPEKNYGVYMLMN